MKTESELRINISTIEETLKVVESGEMRKHLYKYLSHCGDNYNDRCADIIHSAPVSLEHKFRILEQLGFRDYAKEVKSALNERHNHNGDHKNPPGTVYRLFMYDQPKDTSKIFKSYDEAVDYIERTRMHFVSDDRKLVNHEHGRTDIIEKWITVSGEEKLYVYWFLNDAKDVIYYDFSIDDKRRVPVAIPGRLNFSVPFKPGDIVAVDCRPFALERKVVILENTDTLSSTDADNVTCLIVNNHNNTDVGYFKSNEFLHKPENTYVSAMYRSKTYQGEFTKAEVPLGIISEAIKKNTKLGNKIFGFLVMQRVYAISARYEGDTSDRKYYGTDWSVIQKEFGL